MYPLFIAVLVLRMQGHDLPMKNWVKNILIFALIWSAFPADWSCIAVLAILEMYKQRGNLSAQVKAILLYVAMYAVVSFFFVSKTYALVQIGVLLVYPVLKLYNGEKGKAKWMKWFFIYIIQFIRFSLECFAFAFMEMSVYCFSEGQNSLTTSSLSGSYPL